MADTLPKTSAGKEKLIGTVYASLSGIFLGSAASIVTQNFLVGVLVYGGVFAGLLSVARATSKAD
ncbi:MAG: hypothetical protein AAB869_04205 [Patescibacteria group bacterium]